MLNQTAFVVYMLGETLDEVENVADVAGVELEILSESTKSTTGPAPPDTTWIKIHWGVAGQVLKSATVMVVGPLPLSDDSAV